MMNNKKGISAIVATVLIILITVAAVTIIWAAIIPMISNQLDGATDCVYVSSALTVNPDYSCYNSSDDEVKIQVSRGVGDFDLTGIEIFATYEGNTASFVENTNLPDVNGAKVYTLQVGEGLDLDLDGVDGAYVSAKIASGQTEKTCEASAVTQIRAC